jgi:L-threonylcarbamoyladenylate synthase
MSEGVVQEAVAVLRAGRVAVLPTDTVYGLCVAAYRSEPAERLYRLKGRDPLQPSALLAAELDMLLECLPELRGRAGTIARALLPGPYTLILPNPARRYRWVTGSNPDAVGVRVPELPEPTASIVRAVGVVVATSANLPGGPDPRRLEDVPGEILARAGVAVDGGETPGTPSTVIDFTGDEPRVVREGAASSADAVARAVAALA